MDPSYNHDDDDDVEEFEYALGKVSNFHKDKVRDLRASLQSLQNQIEQLEKQKIKLQSDFNDEKENVSKHSAENEQLRLQIRSLKDRPPPRCEECASLRNEFKKLSKFKEQIFCVMVGTDMKGEARADSVSNTIQAIYTQAVDSDEVYDTADEQLPPSPKKSSQRSAPKNIHNSPRRSTTSGLVLRQKETDRTPQKAMRGEPKTRSQNRDLTSPRKTQKDNGVVKGNEQKGEKKLEDVLPRADRNRLQLATNPKRKFFEHDRPSSKRLRVQSPKKNNLEPEPVDNICNESSEALPKILVADTCDPTSDTSQRDHRLTSASSQDDTGDNTRLQGDLPITVIPETVPMEYTEYESEEEESKQQQMTGQTTVRNLDLSPPSHSSTPVCISREPRLGKTPPKEKRVFNVLKEASRVLANTNAKTKAETPDKHPNRVLRHYPSTDSCDEDISSEAGSPVFKRNPSLNRGSRNQTVQSPSLFDDNDDEADLDSSISSTLPPALTTIIAKKIVNKKTPLGNMRNSLRRKAHDKSNPDIDLTDLSVSIQSNPSPSMLSGKVLSKMLASGNNKTEWLSTSVNESPSNLDNKSQQRTNLDDSKYTTGNKNTGQSKLTDQNDISSVGVSSPVRMTRAKRSSQEKANLTLNTSKGSKLFKQTTISSKFFQPVKTPLSNMEGFNGGKLPGSDKQRLSQEEQELKDLEEALQNSLHDLKVKQTQNDLGLTMMDVDMSEPQFTSTPGVTSSKTSVRRTSSDDSTSSDTTIFKKPSTPTTPKHRRRQDHDQELRRSPRHRDEPSQDDTIDPNQSSPESKINPTFSKPRRRPNAVNRTLDLTKHEAASESLQANSEMPHGNGSLDPDVRLSEFDPEVTGAVTSPEAEYFLEPVSFLDIYAAESENRTQSEITQQSKKKSGQTGKDYYGKDPFSDDEAGDGDVSKASAIFSGSKGQNKEQKSYKNKISERLDDSFDRVPKKKVPDYKYEEVERRKAEREKFERYTCRDCERYFSAHNLPEEEKRERMKACKHKSRYAPPGTPDHFWDVEFPDTQEAEERGYMNKTQHKPSEYRRRNPLNYPSSDKDKQRPSPKRSKKAGSGSFLHKKGASKQKPAMGDITALFEGNDSQEDDFK